MSKDTSSLRFIARNTLRNVQFVANENEFENSSNPIHFPPPRTPLDTISDPSQHQRELQELDFNSQIKLKVAELVDHPIKEFENSESQLTVNKGTGNLGLNYGTPRILSRGKSHSEPNSAQSTPARCSSRTSNVGTLGACTGPRPPQSGARLGSSSRVSRGIPLVNSEPSVEVPHFELVEDNSFWKDHNVQVLIRIRPISNTPSEFRGYGRCLRQENEQTLLWLGHPETRFTFDHIACETISQEKLFRVAGLPMVDNCMSGYNSCMFAYGQTGSGKTYTMMGEISQMNGNLGEDCGITPRVFEYLFARIREEEENRRDERLKYSCKCSFLEIYNEQITDLLEPSSTNLQLREDLKKGVYVENLTEHNVRTVSDVLKLLLQGAANRKIAATHMNSESSRSHSVFTCIIESHWEKDSMTHLRFGRLNLVDLAGSERQKSSGAEGNRLKEAANINRSLSILGLVIMSLVDLAHGKQRHIPYRDSRLTFLLQDSLGGNSKTTMIANVSPSFCSANETLSTLKFAQRAKLIQNNAKVNEGASGDVTALQQQIQQLKGQLSFLMQQHNISRSLSQFEPSVQQSSLGDSPVGYNLSGERNISDDHKIPNVRNRTTKCSEAIMLGALRREKLAETVVRRLEAEIAQMSHLAQQMEEDVHRNKTMLRFHEEENKRLELFEDGLVSIDKYLVDENNVLKEEIQLLRASIDRNPELTRLALENSRLLDQLRLFQNFYEQGERETLLAEVSELRDQLLETLEGNYAQHKFPPGTEKQDNDAVKELEVCRKMNSELIKEIDRLRRELNRCVKYQAAFGSVKDFSTKDPEKFKQTDKYSMAETVSMRSDSGDEMASYSQPEDEVLQHINEQKKGDALIIQSSGIQKELIDARFLIEALESEQVHLIEELEFMQEKNQRYMGILCDKDKIGRESVLKLERHFTETCDLQNQSQTLVRGSSKNTSTMVLQAKLDRMTKELEEAQLLNFQYQVDKASQLSQEQQVELVHEQVEMETTKTIIHLEEEVAALQSELQGRLCYMAEDNITLRNTIAAKEEEMKTLCVEWERATLDLTSFLIDGSKSLRDASSHIQSIASSFPHVNVWIGEHVERAAKLCIEKEETILLLQKSLEDAQTVVVEMELKLNSLKGATIALTEGQQLENYASTKAAIQLTTLLNDKINMMELLENRLKWREDQITEAENRADAALLVVKRLSECPKAALRNDGEGYIPMSKLAVPSEVGSDNISEIKANANALLPADNGIKVALARLGMLETENIINVSCTDTFTSISALQTDIHEAFSLFRELVHDLLNDIHEMRKNFVEFRENQRKFQVCALSLEGEDKFPKHENQCYMLYQIRDQLAETNGRLNVINVCISKTLNRYGCQDTAEDLVEVDERTADCSNCGSNLSVESVDLEDRFDEFSSSCCSGHPETSDLEFERDSNLYSNRQESGNSKRFINTSIHNETRIMHLKEELKMANDAFSKLNVWFAVLFDEKEIEDWSYKEGAGLPGSRTFVNKSEQNIFKNRLNQLKISEKTLQPVDLMMQEDEAGCHKTRELIVDGNTSRANSFFMKIEEAHATMKEADFMLNSLLKANENAKQLTGMWKRAGEELMVEKASLFEEIEQLRSSIRLKDGENALLWDQINYTFLEIANLMALFEGFFLETQRDVEQMFKTIYSDALAMVQDMLHCICNSRSSLEDIFSKTMEKGFASLVLFQCHIENFIQKLPSVNVDLSHRQSILHKGYLVTNNSVKNDTVIDGVKAEVVGDESPVPSRLEEKECDNPIYENLLLDKELEWKEVALKRLPSAFSLSQESTSSTNDVKDDTVITGAKGKEEGEQIPVATRLEEKGSASDNLIYENLILKKELNRKDVILKGLLFDFSLLQESASSKKDIKDGTEKLMMALGQVRHELDTKISQFDDMLAQHGKLEGRLADAETALSISNSDLEEARRTLDILSDQNAELRVLLKDIYISKSEAEEQLEEKSEAVKSLEKEIVRMTSSAEKNILSSIEEIENDLKRVTSERDQLREQVGSLQDKLGIAYALADENEAIAVESRQESEASKMYAEQKEEEVKILEHSVEELEFTINVLEKKVSEMEGEVERHQFIRDSLELELQDLRRRMLTVENFTENQENYTVELPEDQPPRQLHNRALELHEAHNRIRVLEEERAEHAKEMKQCKEYISELVLHAEAQASQYQQKYKSLEAMVREVKTNPSTLTSTTPALDKTEKSSMRTRGSSSPFRCIASLVQQMNLEKDQELSLARLRIEELEALAAGQQKEVYMLTTRLAAAESMTHDVIRDLLGVKMDMTNYANLIDQYQLQRFVEGAQEQTQKSAEMEQEILNLRRQISDLIEERERCISEVNKRGQEILCVQMTVEQLNERDQLLTAQNEMLKKDKTNLNRKIAELDDMVRKLIGTQNVQPRVQKQVNSSILRPTNADLSRRLSRSGNQLLRVNDELAQYRKIHGSHSRDENGRK
ncbi:kinesin-like protein KIN-12C [Cornus florida]|uniref:kinesin-like protein KIN-12C n=1 Tax=Cornus florida TaxID=4283 RepID=UPI0028A16633|nr:kinesin-like protein KIN-12C [Cornus florida]